MAQAGYNGTPRTDPPTITSQEAVTALCLYEEALDRANEVDEVGILATFRANNGIFALRDACVALAPYAEADWNALPEDTRDQAVFDWEFIPRWFANRVFWSAHYVPTLINGDTFAAAYTAQVEAAEARRIARQST